MKMKSLSCVSMLAISLSALPASAWAQSDQAIETQIQSLSKELQSLQAEFKKNQIKLKTIEQQQSAKKTEFVQQPRQPFVPPLFAHAPGQTPMFTFGNQVVSFTPYGLMSLGLRNISNWNGRSVNQLETSQYQADRLGGRLFLKLNQDSSIAAIFELGYNGMDGSLGQGGRIFGRQLYVGYVNNKYGMISAGRQLDDMSSALWWSVGITQFDGAAHVGDSDNLGQTFRLNNDLKYTSPVIYHTQISASYAFSNTANQADNGAYSTGIFYNNQMKNSNLKMGAGLLVIDKPVSSTNEDGAVDNDSYGFCSPFLKSQGGAGVKKHSIFSLGSEYNYEDYTVGGNYSNVSFKYLDSSSLRLQNIEIFSMYKILPQLVGGVSYVHTWGRYTEGQTPHYNQVSVGLNYFVGHFVTLFAIDNYQKAGGSAKTAWLDLVAAGSTTQTQNQVMAGVRIAF